MRSTVVTAMRLACLAAVLAGCGKDKEIVYVYPDGWGPDRGSADAASDAVFFGETPDPGKQNGDVVDAAGDVTEVGLPDLGGPPDWVELPGELPIDAYVHADLPPLELPEPDLPPLEDGGTFPEVTTNCDPLGLPNAWAGTFDGEAVSNIPDFAGYTFNGPVYGEISFEIKCINQKYIVVGILDGGATNCALPTGCPFTAKLGGFYNPVEQHLEGTVKDGAIDYAAVVVYAEGVFEGDLVAGPQLTGTWSGQKTSIKNNLLPGLDLSWVDASASGTWTVDPVQE
jgi:hypothetical protein